MRLVGSALVLGAMVWALSGLPSAAQTQPPPFNPPNIPQFGGGNGGGGFGFGMMQPGTVASSNMHGMADVVRSAGYANLLNSAAAQNWQQAYSMDLNNRIQGTNTYFEQRQINREAVAAERGPRVTAAELTRFAREAAPKRLLPSQLDPVTGEIGWPQILRDKRYDQFTKRIDELYNQHLSGGGSSVSYRQISDLIEQLRAAFAQNIRDYNPQNYVDARKFLDSLEYEARFISSG